LLALAWALTCAKSKPMARCCGGNCPPSSLENH